MYKETQSTKYIYIQSHYKKTERDCNKKTVNDQFDILVSVSMKFLFFWVVTPCRLVGRYERFEET
jgi:hypothetical protein